MSPISRRFLLAGAGALASTSALGAAIIPTVAPAMSAEERVRHYFDALADALNELTTDQHGWHMMAGESSQWSPTMPMQRFCSVRYSRIIREPDPRMKCGFFDVQRDGERPAIYFDQPTARPFMAPFQPQVRS